VCSSDPLQACLLPHGTAIILLAQISHKNLPEENIMNGIGQLPKAVCRLQTGSNSGCLLLVKIFMINGQITTFLEK
jgi:hypothetical protein